MNASRKVVQPSFVAHLRCPLCSWSTVASAPGYEHAQRLVSALVVEHVARVHATQAAVNELADAQPERPHTGP